MKEWYQCTGAECLRRLETAAEGLSEQQVRRRREEYGENCLQESGRESVWKIFFGQFQDLLVLILIGAAVISMVTDNVESTVVIFAVIFINAVMGTVQHVKAQKSLESLKSLSAPMAAVMRQGRKVELPSSEIVPGDILCLEAGNLVVADGRILKSASLQVNESSLTGESDTVGKSEASVQGKVPLAERSCMVYSGSLVTAGRATVVVTATGMNTEIGGIAGLMNDTSEKKTPLQVSLDQFGSRLAAAIMVICLVVFLLGLYRGQPVLDSLMFAVALAVAAIPEALGSIVTIVQAMGTQKMAREQAIIKNLKAVESLGCVSVICTDKTGTLTQNRMNVEQVMVEGKVWMPQRMRPENPRHRLFLEICSLANDAVIPEKQKGGAPAGSRGKKTGQTDRGAMGDATELALLAFVQDCGLSPAAIRQQYPRLGEFPFDSERKIMSTIHQGRILTKGALDVLLDRCTKLLMPGRGGSGSMSAADRRHIQEVNLEMSRKGLRVLALVCRELKPGEENLPQKELERDYTFVGLVAMMDPPRQESAAAVLDARRAGIRPVMITGDHKVTAMAIADQIGIRQVEDEVVTGGELDHMDGAELERRLENISVYARVSPEHKLRVVRAWQKRGNLVAMTGDGVNDAPALKQADIGIAMGQNGTEVSKDAADMILADDNFATIIKAVANGRNVYRNIRNAIQFLLSGNMAGIFCVLYTTILALPAPFAPVHLLFINLLTDSLPAIAIGMEPPERELLDSPPRNPKQGILTGNFIKDVLVQGLLIAFCTMWAYMLGLYDGTAVSSEANAALASTMAFSTLTLARLFHGFNCRSHQPLITLGLFSNMYTVMAFEVGTLLLAMVLFAPRLQTLFAVADLSGFQLCCVAVLAALPTIVIQLWKLLRKYLTIS